MPVVLQKYQPCDHKGAVAALQSAFIDDPVFLEIYGKKNISKGLEGVFATLLKFRGTDTHVLKDGDEVVGVVIWDIKKFFPLHEEMTVLRLFGILPGPPETLNFGPQTRHGSFSVTAREDTDMQRPSPLNTFQ
eukprot:TRINITY_DN11358_c0_g2_i2.p1 TRINITY_DN11358_c0_g2~~TRINITY_DN11358_c0_g2_i2.p1  ORF type:complete len:143 (+),score=29.87 TRINITY_DN11358_c0_g2_i2:33-431(+)